MWQRCTDGRAVEARRTVSRVAEPFHEPTHPRAPPRRGAGVHPRISVPLLGGVRGGFMVPMHGRKAEGALHKHPRRAVRLDVESAIRCMVPVFCSGATFRPIASLGIATKNLKSLGIIDLPPN